MRQISLSIIVSATLVAALTSFESGQISDKEYLKECGELMDMLR